MRGRCAWRSISTCCSRCWRGGWRAGLRRVEFVAVCVAVVVARHRPARGVWLHDAAPIHRARLVRRGHLLPDLEPAGWPALGRGAGHPQGIRPRLGAVAARANPALLAGLAVMALSFWLFRERTGLLGNTLGWPVLSLGLALLVFAGATRSADRHAASAGRGLAGGHVLQPVPGAQAGVPPGADAWGAGWKGAGWWRSACTAAPRCWRARRCITRSSVRSCACASACGTHCPVEVPAPYQTSRPPA